MITEAAPRQMQTEEARAGAVDDEGAIRGRGDLVRRREEVRILDTVALALGRAEAQRRPVVEAEMQKASRRLEREVEGVLACCAELGSQRRLQDGRGGTDAMRRPVREAETRGPERGRVQDEGSGDDGEEGPLHPVQRDRRAQAGPL